MAPPLPPDNDRCVAHSTRHKARCKAWRVKGATVCPTHGGRAPQVKAKAAARVAEDNARRAFGRLADVATPVDNPFEALATVAGEIVAWKQFVAGRIAELERLRYEGVTGEQLNAEVALFERSLDRCVSALTAIAKLSLEDRAIRVSQRQAELMETALSHAMATVGMTVEQQEEAATHVVAYLRDQPAAG